MKRSERSPYTRIATDADKQSWQRIFAPIAFVGFVPVTGRHNVTHWAAIIRVGMIRKKHALYNLCDLTHGGQSDPTAEINCVTCIVRIEQGPGVVR